MAIIGLPSSVFVFRPEPLSRGPRLTAGLPDVFEAKLVFSTGGARRALFRFTRGGFEGDRKIAARARSLVMRTIKCHKGIWWMPWR